MCVDDSAAYVGCMGDLEIDLRKAVLRVNRVWAQRDYLDDNINMHFQSKYARHLKTVGGYSDQNVTVKKQNGK